MLLRYFSLYVEQIASNYNIINNVQSLVIYKLSCLFLILKNLFWYVNDDENTFIISSFLTIEKLITLLRKRQTQLSAIYIQTTVITSNRKNPGIHPAMRLIRFPRLVNAGMERPAGAADGGNPCRFVRSLFV